MNLSNFNFRDSKKYWLLSEDIPDIPVVDVQILQLVNSNFALPFVFTGSALLSIEGQQITRELSSTAGRCLGGGVLASRDIEWLSSGKIGSQPGDYIPPKKWLSVSKEPQSTLPSEWIAFEYGFILRSPYGQYFGKKWDDVRAISRVRTQVTDWHVRFDADWDSECTSVYAQANAEGMLTIITIANLVGVNNYI
jgi:hypothetical protein